MWSGGSSRVYERSEQDGRGGAEERSEESETPTKTIRDQDQEHRGGAQDAAGQARWEGQVPQAGVRV